jgi:hypothetical protein
MRCANQRVLHAVALETPQGFLGRGAYFRGSR